MFNFNFSEKGLGLVSPPHFVHDFSRKIFLMLHSINFSRYWAVCKLQLSVNQAATSENLKLTLSF